GGDGQAADVVDVVGLGTPAPAACRRPGAGALRARLHRAALPAPVLALADRPGRRRERGPPGPPLPPRTRPDALGVPDPAADRARQGAAAAQRRQRADDRPRRRLPRPRLLQPGLPPADRGGAARLPRRLLSRSPKTRGRPRCGVVTVADRD